MVEVGRLTRWRGAVSMTAALVVVGAVGWVAARPATAQTPFDVDQARAELADYIATNPPLPAGSDVPADGPPCPLATLEQVVAAAGSLPVSVEPWYSYTAIDSQLQSDVGDRVAVVRCVAATPAPDDVGVSLFALDIGPYDEVGLDFDRVARRFGAGQPAWVELPQIGGDFVGVCRPSEPSRQACLVLWHRDGLVIGAEFTLPATVSGADFDNITIDLVTSVVGTLIQGLPTTTTTTSTTSTSSTSTTSTTSTTTPDTTEPATTEPATTEPQTTEPATTEPETTESTTTSTTTTTTTTLPLPTTTSTTSTTTTSTTTTSTTTTSTTTTSTTTSTTLPPTTLPPTTLPPTTTPTTTSSPTTSTTTTLLPTTTTIPLAPLWEFIDGEPDLTEFADAVTDAGLVALFDGSAPPAAVLAEVLAEPLEQPVLDLLNAEGFTVLAPTNAAIDALPTWNEIAADSEALQHFVLAHVIAGQLEEEEILAAAEVTSLSGDVLLIDPATQTINGAHLVVIGQLSTNGIAHTVDAVVVVPPVAPPTTEATTTVALVQAPPPATEPPSEPAAPPPSPPATGP